MATPSGPDDSTVTAPPPDYLADVERELREYPGRFEFFQAVRLLLRIFPDAEPVGGFVSPESEALRFRMNPSLAFPPSQIDSIDWTGEPAEMTVNFMGLTGPAGVLPYSYSELILERLRQRDRTMAAFFDIFNHRMVSLFYQAWEKYRFPVAFERDGADRLSKYLMSFLGLGTLGLQSRLAVRDEALLFYTGLLSLQPRSASALRNMLEDYFDVPVEVEQFVGSWQPLEPEDQCAFDHGETLSEQLGMGAVAGDAIWDQRSRIRVKLGPLTQEQYLEFLPSGKAHDSLRALTTFFCRSEIEVEAQLILKREDVRGCHLGEAGLAGPRLGWFTWMKSGTEFDRAPGDTILLLR